MTWKLFIDDEREPIGSDWVIARSSKAAIDTIIDRGWPSYISFDHDLGGDDTARPVVNWMIDQILDGAYTGPVPDFYVHSQNPIGREWIRARMGDLQQAWTVMNV